MSAFKCIVVFLLIIICACKQTKTLKCCVQQKEDSIRILKYQVDSLKMELYSSTLRMNTLNGKIVFISDTDTTYCDSLIAL